MHDSHMPTDTHDQYIAHRRVKDGVVQLFEKHLYETGEIAGKLAAKIGMPEARQVLGLLHDFGKYSREFQVYSIAQKTGRGGCYE